MTAVLLSVSPFKEGGAFMYPIFFCLLLSLFFIVIAFIKFKHNYRKSKKMMGLASDTSLLGLVIGCLGSVLGLIKLFDNVESIDSMNFGHFSGELKVTLLTITFGLASFVIARIGITILKWLHNDNELI